jgi:hypothetical protein
VVEQLNTTSAAARSAGSGAARGGKARQPDPAPSLPPMGEADPAEVAGALAVPPAQANRAAPAVRSTRHGF